MIGLGVQMVQLAVTLPVNAESHRQDFRRTTARTVLARRLADEGWVEDAEVH